jgi:deazaflavin-dependent oxidoreductase (nitroreductase family)
MKIVKQPQLPAGLTRLLFRAPIWIYQVGLGGVFGRRLLLLNHIGRRTGAPRKTILEVVQYEPSDGSYVVASGWGPQAAWYRNIVENPAVSVEVANRTIPVTAEPLTEDVGAEIFANYAARRPRIAAFVLPRVLGMSVDGSEADFRAVGRRIPFVRLTPRL